MTTQASGTTGVSKVQDGVVTQPDLAANVVGNGPAFSAYPSGAGQLVTSAVWTKVSLYAEEFDTASAFDAETFRFAPQVAGYYQIEGTVAFDGSTGITVCQAAIYKNGAAYKHGSSVASTGSTVGAAVATAVVYLNGTTDYVELWGRLIGTTAVINQNSSLTHFSGFLVRAA